MTTPAIAVHHLSREFGGRPVLRDVSLDVAAGELVTVVGLNGSGKTTLLEILATLLTPSSGSVSVHGYDIVERPAEVRRLVGYAPSNLQSFYPRLSGRRNLYFFAALYGLERRPGRARADWLLDRVGLSPSAGERVERYSDGMKARLSIARALLTDAPVLLLDEPTKSLDQEARGQIRSLIVDTESRAGRRTIVWVTHDPAEVSASDMAVNL